MTEATALPPAAQHYLEQLRLESAALPAAERQQLLSQISEHLSESVDEGADVATAIDRLGSPRELVAEAGADTPEPAPEPWRPSALLWLAVGAIAVGAFMLLWGSGIVLITGRGRSLLLVIPGLVIVIAGVVLMVRALRTSRGNPSAARAQWRIVRWLAIAAIVAGALVLLLGGVAALVTSQWRSIMLAIPAIVLVLGGVATLVLAVSRSRRSGL